MDFSPIQYFNQIEKKYLFQLFVEKYINRIQSEMNERWNDGENIDWRGWMEDKKKVMQKTHEFKYYHTKVIKTMIFITFVNFSNFMLKKFTSAIQIELFVLFFYTNTCKYASQRANSWKKWHDKNGIVKKNSTIFIDFTCHKTRSMMNMVLRKRQFRFMIQPIGKVKQFLKRIDYFGECWMFSLRIMFNITMVNKCKFCMQRYIFQ